MDKQRETERIAKAMYGLYCGKDECGSCKKPRDCESYHTAELLVKKGIGGVSEAVKEFAERVKMAFYYEFDELIPSIMADKIDEIVKEVCGEDE